MNDDKELIESLGPLFENLKKRAIELIEDLNNYKRVLDAVKKTAGSTHTPSTSQDGQRNTLLR